MHLFQHVQLDSKFMKRAKLSCTMVITLGVILTIYATIKLLSYEFQTTFWSAPFGFLLIGVGIYMFDRYALLEKA